MPKDIPKEKFRSGTGVLLTVLMYLVVAAITIFISLMLMEIDLFELLAGHDDEDLIELEAEEEEGDADAGEDGEGEEGD